MVKSGTALFRQPADGDEMLDGMKLRITRQNRAGQTAGCGDTKRICVGDRMLALNLCRLSHEWQIHRDQVDGQLFQEMESFSGSGSADLAFDDVEELAPVDPIQKRLGAAPCCSYRAARTFSQPGSLWKRLTSAKLSRTSFSLTARLLPVLPLEIGRQGELTREKARSRRDGIVRRRCNDEATALLDQLDLAARLKAELAAKLAGNQNVALFRNMGDRHRKVLQLEISVS